MQELSPRIEEQIILRLCSLYSRYGYAQYKMNKFEEYDLYARNKNFLISDSVITFTDTNGRLMALKPDVTLSIVKNCRLSPGSVQKLYYNENVYRVAGDSRSFREIMQVGLECLGEVDDYLLCEVLRLAALSLRTISEECILDLSHLGLLSELIDSFGAASAVKPEILRLIGEKNPHELRALCAGAGLSEENISMLCRLAAIGGTPERVLPEAEAILRGRVSDATLDQFIRIVSALDGGVLRGLIHIDFSVVDDLHYYNGFVFKGFVRGLPGSVLSGGQYDSLMRQMEHCAGAIGFAVYTDQLECLTVTKKEFDIDAILLYDEDTPLAVLSEAVAALTDEGISVSARRALPEGVRCRRLYQIKEGEVILLENHA